MVVDREAASDLGISVGTIADTLRILVGGMPISTFRDGGEQYDVWLRAEAERPLEPSQDLYGLSLPSPNDRPVAVEPGHGWTRQRGPSQIERKDRAAHRHGAGQSRRHRAGRSRRRAVAKCSKE